MTRRPRPVPARVYSRRGQQSIVIVFNSNYRKTWVYFQPGARPLAAPRSTQRTPGRRRPHTYASSLSGPCPETDIWTVSDDSEEEMPAAANRIYPAGRTRRRLDALMVACPCRLGAFESFRHRLGRVGKVARDASVRRTRSMGPGIQRFKSMLEGSSRTSLSVTRN